MQMGKLLVVALVLAAAVVVVPLHLFMEALEVAALVF
jgi:hypothetical protein